MRSHTKILKQGSDTTPIKIFKKDGSRSFRNWKWVDEEEIQPVRDCFV